VTGTIRQIEALDQGQKPSASRVRSGDGLAPLTIRLLLSTTTPLIDLTIFTVAPLRRPNQNHNRKALEALRAG
jgi:hypothetical protein